MPDPIAQLDELTDNSAKVVVLADGLQLVLARRGDKVWAYKNACPHMGVGLDSAGDKLTTYDDSFLICTMHGAMFEFATGYCLGGPCEGFSLTSVPICVENGVIYLANEKNDES